MHQKIDLYFCLLDYIKWKISLEAMDKVFWGIYYEIINTSKDSWFSWAESQVFHQLLWLFSRYSPGDNNEWSLSYYDVTEQVNIIIGNMWINNSDEKYIDHIYFQELLDLFSKWFWLEWVQEKHLLKIIWDYELIKNDYGKLSKCSQYMFWVSFKSLQTIIIFSSYIYINCDGGESYKSLIRYLYSLL